MQRGHLDWEELDLFSRAGTVDLETIGVIAPCDDQTEKASVGFGLKKLPQW